MKCEYCGGNLSLTEEKCPHCGKVNRQAQQHIDDMKRYQNEFEQTKKAVYTKAQLYTKVVVRVVILAVLVILSGVFWWVGDNVYSIKGNLQEQSAERNAKEYKKILNQYLDEKKYVELALFCEEKRISGFSDVYDEYGMVIQICGQYRHMTDMVMNIVDDRESLRDNDYNIVALADWMDSFFEYREMMKSNYIEDDVRERNVEVWEKIQQRINSMLQIYCGLTDEDTKQLESMSKVKRAALLEDRLLGGDLLEQ